MSGMAQRFAGLAKVPVAVVVLLLVAAALLFLGRGDSKRYLTVDFQQTNSVYKGSDVKILGVPVGEVESLTPRGDVVRVKIAYDGKYFVWLVNNSDLYGLSERLVWTPRVDSKLLVKEMSVTS